MMETTIKQGFRMLAAGCPDIELRYQGEDGRRDGHKIVPVAIHLGKLWDMAHKLGEPGLELPTADLTSNEVIEALVAYIEDYYKELNNGKG